jgi:hypothetical protein
MKRSQSAVKDKAKDVEIEQKLFMCRISMAKLLADFCFCYYDIAEFTSAPRFQALCGFIAGFLGLYKLWIKALK